jgi:tetratricopeptide (TPR) repeat protein
MRKSAYLVFVALYLALAGCSPKTIPAGSSKVGATGVNNPEYEYSYVEAIKQKLMGNTPDALRYFERCIELNPSSDASYYQMGQILAAAGDMKNARGFVRKALDLNDSNMWYLMLMSDIYYQEKNIDSAIYCYEKAVKKFPSNENILLSLGNLYIENNRFEDANIIFDSFDKKYGFNEASTLSSVHSLVSSGRFADAKIKIEALLKEDPENILYNGLYAEILAKAGESEKAAGVYQRLLETHPGDPQVQFSLCDFLIQQKSYDELFRVVNMIVLNQNIKKEEKVSFFARILENEDIVRDKDGRFALSLMVFEADNKDDDIIPMLRTDLLIKQNKYGEAVKRLEEVTKERPENYYAWEKLLLLYLQQGDFQNLTIRGEECARRFNMSFTAKILYANGLIETGKFDTALEELRKAEILAGNNSQSILQVLTMRADVYYRNKQYTEAFDTYEKALKVGNEDLTVLNNYAYYLAEQNTNLKEAEDLARKVIEREKENSTFLDTYGWVLYKRGKLGDAEKVMEYIIGKEKPDAEYYEHYGFILKKQNKCERAIEAFETAMKLDGSKSYLNKEIEDCKK